MRASKKYQQDFWDCRDFGHAWIVQSCVVVETRPLQYERTFTCARQCGTKRSERFVAGALDGRSYGYKPGYQVKGMNIKQRMNFRADVRMFNLAREARQALDKKKQ